MSDPRRGLRLAAVLVLALLLPACGPPAAERKPAAWSYVGTRIEPLWWYALVGVPAARARGAAGEGVTVAVLDTGVLPGHEDLPAVRGVATCGANPADFTDRRGHGTQVAGIVAGKDPGNATRGLAPAASLFAVKIDCGLVAPGSFTQGLDRAIQARPGVVLLPLGGYPPGAAAALLDRVRQHRDVLFVVASVWDGRVEPFPEWTRSDNAIVVAAMTLANGTPGGKAAGYREVPYDGRRGDIAAPGRDIETADIVPDPARPAVRAKYLMQGSSAAAAIVAGCGALVKQRTGLAAPALKTALVNAAERKPELDIPRLNCARAIP
jgi:subtilisin family serine protease